MGTRQLTRSGIPLGFDDGLRVVHRGEVVPRRPACVTCGAPSTVRDRCDAHMMEDPAVVVLSARVKEHVRRGGDVDQVAHLAADDPRVLTRAKMMENLRKYAPVFARRVERQS